MSKFCRILKHALFISYMYSPSIYLFIRHFYLQYKRKNVKTDELCTYPDKNSNVKVLLACTGSVASIKIPLLIKSLTFYFNEENIKLVSTQNALHFFEECELNIPVIKDVHEWNSWTKIGDKVLHIDIRNWADVLVIAPLDANTLAKMSNGICDNLLTCIVRAWNPIKPLLFAPAMNTTMWNHPLTNIQINILKSFGYIEIPCIQKTLACGDTGFGAMAEVSTIVSKVLSYLDCS